MSGMAKYRIARNDADARDGVHYNSRKFEDITLHAFEKHGETVIDVRKKFHVFVVPKNETRGEDADHFQVVVNGVSIESTDLSELRRKAQEAYREIVESEYERVLIVTTSGDGYSRKDEQGNTFGLTWRQGWRCKKIDLVMDETRMHALRVENYDEDYVPEVIAGGYTIGAKPGHRGKQTHKTAVIPWTQAREDMLRKTITAIEEMRQNLNEALLKPDAFASLLDSKAGSLMLGTTK